MRPIGVGSVPRARMIGLQITAMALHLPVRGVPLSTPIRSLAYSDLDDRSSNVRSRFARIDYRRRTKRGPVLSRTEERTIDG